MNNPRLYIPMPLSEGATCELNSNQCNYLKNVLRMSEGGGVTVFNGKNGEWQATISELSKKNGQIRAEKQLRKQTESPDVWLLFAPIKHGRIDWLVEKATELGIDKLQPVFTKHTIVNRLNGERLEAHAIEASEQCERLSVPELLPALALDKLLNEWDGNRKIILCDESGAGKPMLEALMPYKGKGGKWAIIIGPEGGFSKAELEKLKSQPYVLPVSLGPRVLRADTAALAAIGCWQTVLGDWQEGTPAFRNRE